MERDYHLCLSPDALEADATLLDTVREAGVSTIWLTGFLYGYWHYPVEQAVRWREQVQRRGMKAHVVNVPLGHPGDALGAMHGNVPLTPPRHWRMGVRSDGSQYAGTSLHPPACEENTEAIRLLARHGFRQAFLDDDFRLAQSPGTVGGCFCPEHRQRFLQKYGYAESRWEELLHAVQQRRLSPVLRHWCEFHCDELTSCFRTLQRAERGTQLGIMVMYMGSEKAGIRLGDYSRVPFRVGEGMFDDGSFGSLKGRMNELFSVLFHRRFVRPEMAFSETTAYPADRLSARHLAAKLVISTLADVRHTMFMSGLSPFPRSYWETLAPAMRKQAQLHRQVAGQQPAGPLKHFWGEAGRYVGDDDPFSLFMAMGVPFEVSDTPPRDGWVFLGDQDATELPPSTWKDSRAVRVVRPHVRCEGKLCRRVEEALPALFALKQEIVATLKDVPWVEEDKPVVCVWYPKIFTVALWNLSEGEERLTVRFGERRYTVSVPALDLALVSLSG